jgi:hypothetical protein
MLNMPVNTRTATPDAESNVLPNLPGLVEGRKLRGSRENQGDVVPV